MSTGTDLAALPGAVIESRGFTKRYGKFLALDGVNLEIPSASVGLLGANGAGKTTMLGLVLGMHRPDAGRMQVLGRDPADMQAAANALIACGGFLVDGGIYRHEFVTRAVIDGIMRVMLDTGMPVLSMILTPKNTYEHDRDHSFFLEHFVIKGEELANAAVTTLKNKQGLQPASSPNK